MIKIINGNKIYQNNKKALKDLNITLCFPFYCAIVGSSGSGKSTLLNIIAGYDKLSSGQYIHETSLDNIGMIFQDYQLLDYLTVEDNLKLPFLYKDKCVDNNKLKEIINNLKLADCLKQYPYQLSGGQKQRVCIARMLLMGKKIILADEPTGSLDEVNRDNILAIFASLYEKGISILVATHDKNVYLQAKEIIRLENGNIV